MAIVVKDRVKVTTSTTGTGTLTLGSAETDFQSFSVIGDGNQTYYAIKSDAGWEVGIGTYTLSSSTLSRDTILESSNSGSAVSLTGTSTVFTTYPAERASFSDQGISKTFTADGAITAGKPTILTSAGKAQEVKLVTTGAITEAYSAETALNDPSEKVTVVSDGDNTFLMVYQGTSNYTTIQAGTMSGTTMTWGTAQVFESTDSSGQSAWWDSYRSCFVVVARGTASNSHIRGKTITVSGQAITIVDSSDTTVFSGSYDQSSMVGGYDSTAQVGFVVNSRGNSPTKTSVIVVSIDSSKNISWGSEVTSNDRIYYASQFVHDTNGNGNVSVIGARYNSSTTVSVSSTQAYVITISGTTPTIQTPVVLNSSTYMHGYSVYDASANKTICIYDDATKVYYNVCSMSSGTLTAGTHTEIATGSLSGDTQETAYCGCYDPFTQQIGIVYGDSSNYYYLRSGKVSGTSITWSDAQAVDPSTANKHINLVNANSTDSNVLVLYWVNYDSAFNTWTMGSAGTTTANLDNNYLGVASTTASDTEEVKINLPEGSINNSQSGLEIGEDYFCNTSGEIKKFMQGDPAGYAPSSVGAVDTSAGSNLVAYTNQSVSYDTDTNTLLATFKDGDNGDYPTCIAGTVNATTGVITWGTPTVINSQSGDRLVTLGGGGKHHLLWNDGAYNNYVRWATVSGTTITLNSGGTITAHTDNDTYNLGVWCSDISRFVIFYSAGSEQETYARICEPTSTGYTVGSNIDLNVGEMTANGTGTVTFDPDTNRTLLTYRNSTALLGNVLTITTSGITVGSQQTISTEGWGGGTVAVYDTNIDRIIFVYDAGSGGSTSGMNARVIAITGGSTNTISVTSATHIQSNNSSGECGIAFNSTDNKTYVTPKGQSGIKSKQYPLTSTVSGVTVGTAVEVSDSTGTNMHSSIYDPDTDVVVTVFNEDFSSSKDLKYFSLYQTTTYTKTDAQYIGEAISTTALKLKETPTDIIFGKTSGSITKGKPTIVEADGDFAQVVGTTTTISAITGAGVHNIQTGNTQDKFGMASDGAGVVCAIWLGQFNYPYVAKATIDSGNTLNWGTPVVLTSDASTFCSAYYDKTNTFYVVQYSSGNSWYAFRVEGSGSTATASNVGSSSTSAYGLGTGVSQGVSVYDETQSCGVTFLGNATSKLGLLTSNQAQTSAGGGTGLGYRGLSSQIGSAGSSAGRVGLDFDQTNNVGCMWYRDEDNGNYPTVRAFTINGSTTYGDAVLGTAVVLISNGTNAYGGIACGHPDSAEWVTVWRESSTELWYSTLTLSGTDITNTTALAMARDGSEEYYVEGTQLLTYNPKSKKYYFSYNNSADNYDVMLKELSYSNGAITVDSTIKVIDASSSYTENYYWNVKWVGNTAVEAQEGYMLLLGKYGNPTNSTGTTYYAPEWTKEETNLTSENFIGFADTTSTANETSKVKIIGLDVNQDGLNAGQIYYVKNDATLSETAETGKVVEAGKAISATKLLVKG